ncbi:proteasome assembly chaperone 3 [[Emmonsia] crescens]|uniref:Proteasome assembly chaperone 3 n=1 Tax=[Emmonsia] crescens TaxID=73230 RepID=A0A2B7ZBE0_9EURO|nr:proteasome assembly chaperone 3 [Emmonsia crescens]
MSALSIPPNAQLEEMMRGAGPLPDQTNLPYPASTKQAAGVLGGVLTEVMSVSFSDKILVTISQNGKLGQWLHVPLENTNPGTDGYHTLPDPNEDGLLPLPSLTATSVLGARGSERETIGQLYACQIATVIATKNPNEKRLLVVGLGLEQPEIDRDVFFGVIDLVLKCI